MFFFFSRGNIIFVSYKNSVDNVKIDIEFYMNLYDEKTSVSLYS